MTMTAREKFSKGRRVKLSAKGLSWAKRNYKRLNESTRATVTGYGRDPTVVKIQRDDIRTIMAFHMDFWEPAPEQLPLLPLDCANSQRPRIFTSIAPAKNPFTGRDDGSANVHTFYDAKGMCLGGGLAIRYKHPEKTESDAEAPPSEPIADES